MDLYYKSGQLYCRKTAELKEYFYEDGTLKTIEKEGEIILYWPNGQMKRKCSFQNGVRHGMDQMWNEVGALVDVGQYENGKPVGVHRIFGNDGQLIEENTYVF